MVPWDAACSGAPEPVVMPIPPSKHELLIVMFIRRNWYYVAVSNNAS